MKYHFETLNSLEIAELAMRHNAWRTAIEYFSHHFHTHGRTKELLVQMAHAQKEAKFYFDAISTYKSALEIDRDFLDAKVHLAHLYKNIGLVDDSIFIFSTLRGTSFTSEAERELNAIKSTYYSDRKATRAPNSIELSNGTSGNCFELININFTDNKYIANSPDPQILINENFIGKFGILIEEVSHAGRLEIFCDYGNGFTEQGHFFVSSDEVGPKLFLPPDFDRVKRIRIDPINAPGPFEIRLKTIASKWSLYQALGLSRARYNQTSVIERIIGSLNLTGAYRQTLTDFRRNVEIASSGIKSLDLQFDDDADDFLGRSEILYTIIVPVYNIAEKYLRRLYDSVRLQTESNFEVIFVDDMSTEEETKTFLDVIEADECEGISVIRLIKNSGIASATNAALKHARGKWVTFLDHDDELHHNASQILSIALQKFEDKYDIVYTDESIVDSNGDYLGEFCKPAYNEILLSSMNYMNHLTVYRTDSVRAVGGLRTKFNGSQDYDLLLRCISHTAPERIGHIPYPLYKWRRMPGTFSDSFINKALAAARQALKEFYKLKGKDVDVLPGIDPQHHRIEFRNRSKSLVSIVIPNRNSLELIRMCLDGLLDHTTYRDFEIIIVDNSSDSVALKAYYESLEASHAIRVIYDKGDFNFSRLVNLGASQAQGDYLLLLNNDIEIIDDNWLDELVSCFNYDSVGIVGSKLLYPDGSIQHAGVIVGLGNAAGHWHVGDHDGAPGAFGRLHARQSLTAVTGACMLISKTCWDDVGGFDEKDFAVAYNDIDFCLRAGQLNYRCVWTPYATLIHHESVSRGSDERPENYARWLGEFIRFQNKWNAERYSDQAYSPWFDRMSQHPRVQFWKRPAIIRGSSDA